MDSSAELDLDLQNIILGTVRETSLSGSSRHVLCNHNSYTDKFAEGSDAKIKWRKLEKTRLVGVSREKKIIKKQKDKNHEQPGG